MQHVYKQLFLQKIYMPFESTVASELKLNRTSKQIKANLLQLYQTTIGKLITTRVIIHCK